MFSSLFYSQLYCITHIFTLTYLYIYHCQTAYLHLIMTTCSRRNVVFLSLVFILKCFKTSCVSRTHYIRVISSSEQSFHCFDCNAFLFNHVLACNHDLLCSLLALSLSRSYPPDKINFFIPNMPNQVSKIQCLIPGKMVLFLA